MQKSRPTQNKRARERARQEKRQQKEARRLENRGRREPGQGSPSGEDPDIAGIVPGPQANPWGDEVIADNDDEEDDDDGDEGDERNA